MHIQCFLDVKSNALTNQVSMNHPTMKWGAYVGEAEAETEDGCDPSLYVSYTYALYPHHNF